MEQLKWINYNYMHQYKYISKTCWVEKSIVELYSMKSFIWNLNMHKTTNYV